MAKLTAIPENYGNLRSGIVDLLQAARSAAARNVNSIMTAVYWDIGRRIVMSEQAGEQRAGYGEQLVEQLSRDLTRRFGRGFGRANLWQMRAFYTAWPEARVRPKEILSTKILPTKVPGEDSPDTDSPDTVWRIREPQKSQDARG